MNPEEGELRPQLLDRISLHVEVLSIFNEEQRIEIMKRNLEFEEDPINFRQKFQSEQREIQSKILKAEELLPSVKISRQLLEIIARMCIGLRVDGHRPDIIILKASKTLAAFNERLEVVPEDVLTCSYLALSHRTRNLGMEGPATQRQVKEAFEKAIKRE